MIVGWSIENANGYGDMKIKTRDLTSLLLAGAFAVASVSGVALYVKPKGRVANWTGWTLAGLDKSQWEALHTNACLLLLVAAAAHLYLNWRPFFSYLKRRQGRKWLRGETVLAAILLTAVSVGTLAQLPPFSLTADWGGQIKKYWERSAASHGPAPHAEEFSIERFARSIDLSTEELIAILRQEGLRFSDKQTTIDQLARDNELTPAELYTAITKHRSDAIRNASAEQEPRMYSAP